jgi:hypothetical protein
MRRSVALLKFEYNIVMTNTIKKEKEKQDVSHEEVKRGVKGERMKV